MPAFWTTLETTVTDLQNRPLSRARPRQRGAAHRTTSRRSGRSPTISHRAAIARRAAGTRSERASSTRFSALWRRRAREAFGLLCALAPTAAARTGHAAHRSWTAAGRSESSRRSRRSHCCSISAVGGAARRRRRRARPCAAIPTIQGKTWRQVQGARAARMLTAVLFRRCQARLGRRPRRRRSSAREDGGDTWERIAFRARGRSSRCSTSGSATRQRGIAVGAYGAILHDRRRRPASGSQRTVRAPPLPEAAKVRRLRPTTMEADVDLGIRVPPECASRAARRAGCTSRPRRARLYRSDDGGASWRELPSPYEGSFYRHPAARRRCAAGVRPARHTCSARRTRARTGPRSKPAPSAHARLDGARIDAAHRRHRGHGGRACW